MKRIYRGRKILGISGDKWVGRIYLIPLPGRKASK
jgi:hypothetical protein